MNKTQRMMMVLDHYDLVLSVGDKTELTTLKGSKRVCIKYTSDATPEDIMHEVAHYLLLKLGLSPWLVVPRVLREGWRDNSLPEEWKDVVDMANELDHSLAFGRIYEDLCLLISE